MHDAFLIVAFVLLFISMGFQAYRSSMTRQITAQQAQTTPTVIPKNKNIANQDKSTRSNLKVNLNGSYTCKTASMSAFIKQKKARITLVQNDSTEQYLFDGDCIYSWETGDKTGTKSCGYSQMIFMLGLFGSSVDIGSILPYLSTIGSFAGAGGTPAPDLESLFNNCTESVDIKNSNFNLPKDITFTESEEK